MNDTRASYLFVKKYTTQVNKETVLLSRDNYEIEHLKRCLPDSPKLGFRLGLGLGIGLGVRVRVSISANWVLANRVSVKRD